MQRDTLVFDIINKELARQRHGIELIASENFTSLQVIQASGSVMTNKYAEGYPGRRYYAGCEFVDQTEQLAIDRIKQIFNCEYANVQPHSGAQANAAITLALLQPGDKIRQNNSRLPQPYPERKRGDILQGILAAEDLLQIDNFEELQFMFPDLKRFKAHGIPIFNSIV